MHFFAGSCPFTFKSINIFCYGLRTCINWQHWWSCRCVPQGVGLTARWYIQHDHAELRDWTASRGHASIWRFHSVLLLPNTCALWCLRVDSLQLFLFPPLGAPKQIPPFDFPAPMPPSTLGKADVSAVSLDSVTAPGCSDTILLSGTPQYEVDMQDSSLEEAHHDVSWNAHQCMFLSSQRAETWMLAADQNMNEILRYVCALPGEQFVRGLWLGGADFDSWVNKLITNMEVLYVCERIDRFTTLNMRNL